MQIIVPSGKKVVLFDLGGVLVDLDMQKTFDAFAALGFPDFHNHFDSYSGSSYIEDFEEGKITPLQFIDEIKKNCNPHTTQSQIITAWNAMLGELPLHKAEFLKQCKSNFKVYLYSNTNEIHVDYLIKYYNQLLGENVFESFFDKIYYSFELGIRKPRTEGYVKIIEENNLLAQDIFYIEDGKKHAATAQQLGLTTLVWKMNDSFQ